MSDLKLSEIQWLVNSPAFGLRDNTGARKLRHEVHADWLESLFNRIYSGRDSVEDARAESTAGVGHTVESMVADLAQRVGLQSIEKQASVIPLSKKADSDPKQLLSKMREYLITYHLRPTHGLKEPEALYDALKDKFGPDTVQQLGRDAVMHMVEQTREQHAEPSLVDGLPKYDGTPAPLKSDQALQDEQNASAGPGSAMSTQR